MSNLLFENWSSVKLGDSMPVSMGRANSKVDTDYPVQRYKQSRGKARS